LNYTKNQIRYIITASEAGKSSRFIADKLGLSKSGVQQHINAAKQPVLSKQGAKILFYDVETTPSLAYTFGRFKVNLGQDNIAQEGGELLMASYRWAHEKETKFIGSTKWIREGTNDANIAAALWELYEEADVAVGHNLKRFDHPMLQTSCVKANLPPLPTVQLVDTLQIAKKKFRFSSNKLDSLGAVLGLGRKQSHSGIDLWIKVMHGENKAFQEMQEYCIQDTDLLVKVYNVLANRGLVSTFNAANYYDDEIARCGTCGSSNLEHTGRIITTNVSKFEEVRCEDCGTISRTRKNLNSKEKTSSLIIRV
jgi:hypothetical protein